VIPNHIERDILIEAPVEGVEAREGHSLLVEFTLTPEGDHTRLKVVESGLLAMDWPEEQKTAYARDHARGWEIHLGSLRDHLARQTGVSSSR
jgi:hypothetical protein